MKLSVIDRLIIIQSLLPEKGTVEMIKLKISIKKELGFTDEESLKFNIVHTYNNMLQINNITDDMSLRNADYIINNNEVEFLATLAKNYSDDGCVTESSLDTIEMLIKKV